MAAGARIVGPVRIAAGAEIEAGAEVGPDAVIDAGARVAAGARVRRAVVWSGADGDRRTYTDAVVDPGRLRGVVGGRSLRTVRDVLASTRTATTVMLSTPPFLFASAISFSHMTSRSFSLVAIAEISSSLTMPDRPSEQSR